MFHYKYALKSKAITKEEDDDPMLGACNGRTDGRTDRTNDGHIYLYVSPLKKLYRQKWYPKSRRYKQWRIHDLLI